MTKHNSPDMKASIHTDIIDRIMEVCHTNEDVDKLLMILAANLNI